MPVSRSVSDIGLRGPSHLPLCWRSRADSADGMSGRYATRGLSKASVHRGHAALRLMWSALASTDKQELEYWRQAKMRSDSLPEARRISTANGGSRAVGANHWPRRDLASFDQVAVIARRLLQSHFFECPRHALPLRARPCRRQRLSLRPCRTSQDSSSCTSHRSSDSSTTRSSPQPSLQHELEQCPHSSPRLPYHHQSRCLGCHSIG